MANGLVNYNILKPELATSFAQGFQDAQTQNIRQQAAKQQIESEKTQMQFNQEKLGQLRQERDQMLKLQQDLAAKGQNPDLDFVFDTMVKSGIPDYMTKGLEGKRKLDEQRRFAQVMGFDMGAPAAPAAPNALAGNLPPPPPAAVGEGMTPMPVAPAAAPTAAAPRNAMVGGDETARLTQQINGLLSLGTPQSVQAAQVLQSRLTSMQKPQMMSVSGQGAVFDPITKQFYTPPKSVTGEAEPPKLKQGERWNPQKQRVEAVEGSDIFKKQKSAFTQDYKVASSVADKMDEGIKKVDDLLDPKNAGGFEGNFGGYNAYATRVLTGENTDVRKKIDSFKSTLKSAGLELMRQGGAIGQMTVQEWPIVEQMIDAISPELSETEAKRAFNEIRGRFNRIKERAKDVYETEYSDSQFYRPLTSLTGGGATAAPSAGAAPTAKPAPAVGTVQQGYRFKGGDPGNQANWEKVK